MSEPFSFHPIQVSAREDEQEAAGGVRGTGGGANLPPLSIDYGTLTPISELFHRGLDSDATPSDQRQRAVSEREGPGAGEDAEVPGLDQ